MTWQQVPDPRPVPTGVLGPVVLAAVPALLQARGADLPAWWPTLLIVAFGGASALGRRRPNRWGVIGLALAIGLISVEPSSMAVVRVTAVSVPALVIWAVALGAVRWLPGPTSEGRTFRFAIVPLAGADLLLILGDSFRTPVLLVGAGAVIAATATALREPSLRVLDAASRWLRVERCVRLVDRTAQLLGDLAAGILMIPALAIITIVWSLQRLTGYDPLDGRSPGSSRWVERTGHDPAANRFFSAAPVTIVRSRRQRLAGAGSVLAALAIIGSATWVAVREEGASTTGTEFPSSQDTGSDAMPATPTGGRSAKCEAPSAPPAADDPDHWAALYCETEAAASHAEFYAPGGYRLSDFKGAFVNITDGSRRTWRPPKCACRRLSVWLFGGSAAWGYYQSDERSLASQLARRAWDEGIALDVQNYAMPGYTLGQGVRTFADLTTLGPPPDLVIFHDGGNDLLLQAERYFHGSIADESDVQLMESAFDDLLSEGPRTRDPDHIVLRNDEPPSEVPEALIASAPEIARHAMARFGRQAGLAERLAESVGADIAITFQPLNDGSKNLGGDESFSPASKRLFEELFSSARTQLPEGSIDLGGVFDRTDEPVYFDQFHTSERGAKIVARALLDELVPALKERER